MSETIKHENIVAALAAAQGEFGEIKKSKTAKIYSKKTNSSYEYHYADLAAVLEATRPVLSKHGLAVSWVFRQTERGGDVITRLLFHGSDPLESVIPVYFEHDMQSLGSAITYAKRYGLCGLIGVVAEDDDDGQAAGQAEPTRSKSNGEAKKSQQPAKQERKATQQATYSEPANQGRGTLEIIQGKIAAITDPVKFREAATKCAQKYATNLEFLEEVFDAFANHNRSAAERGTWDEEERKKNSEHLLASLKKLAEATGEETESRAKEESWEDRIARTKDPATLMGLIGDLTSDADLVGQIEHFRAICDLVRQAITQRESFDGWGKEAASLLRQHLQSRETMVELQHTQEESQ